MAYSLKARSVFTGESVYNLFNVLVHEATAESIRLIGLKVYLVKGAAGEGGGESGRRGLVWRESGGRCRGLYILRYSVDFRF